MIKFFLYFFFISFSYSNLFSKNLNISGLKKLSYDDLQSISEIDIYKDSYTNNDINSLINDLYNSDLIFNVELSENDNEYILLIEENKILNDIYFVNNSWLKDDQLLEALNSKNYTFFSKDKLIQDINIINSLYKAKGFHNVTTVAKMESFSDDKINLIFDIHEGDQSKLNLIRFIGNNEYSGKFLSSKITSQSLKFYNFFKSGSNFNPEIFNYDKNILENFYLDNGFFDIKISYSLEKNLFGVYSLTYFIEEGPRYIIDEIIYNEDIEKLFFFEESINKFKSNLIKDNNYYSKNQLNELLDTLNISLIKNNINNYFFDINLNFSKNTVDLSLIKVFQEQNIIKNINIYGNSITKNSTIRSKLLIEPGDIYNQYFINRSKNNLKKFSYIKDVTIENNFSDGVNLDLTIDEFKKTGNILLAGTFNNDTQFGLTFGIQDKNFAGSGNIIDANFDINSEDLKFNLNYTQFPLFNPYISNTFSIFNQEQDLLDSFGYKLSKKGLAYKINFDQSENLRFGIGLSLADSKGHSPKNNNIGAISDSIGNFTDINLSIDAIRDTTNDVFNPTNGSYNSLAFFISPNNISDDPFFKLVLTNKNYFNIKNSDNYFFLNNNFGYSESLKSNLKTINSFSLGGNNFKGFDFRGIGPKTNSFYLGGNKFFTSTLGFGSSFLFDKKDNVNIKLFATAGSLWDSDYSNDNEFDLRTSVGVSFDFITNIGPISFSYAVPINKSNTDSTREFSFTIGTSF